MAKSSYSRCPPSHFLKCGIKVPMGAFPGHPPAEPRREWYHPSFVRSPNLTALQCFLTWVWTTRNSQRFCPQKDDVTPCTTGVRERQVFYVTIPPYRSFVQHFKEGEGPSISGPCHRGGKFILQGQGCSKGCGGWTVWEDPESGAGLEYVLHCGDSSLHQHCLTNAFSSKWRNIH